MRFEPVAEALATVAPIPCASRYARLGATRYADAAFTEDETSGRCKNSRCRRCRDLEWA